MVGRGSETKKKSEALESKHKKHTQKRGKGEKDDQRFCVFVFVDAETGPKGGCWDAGGGCCCLSDRRGGDIEGKVGFFIPRFFFPGTTLGFFFFKARKKVLVGTQGPVVGLFFCCCVTKKKERVTRTETTC